jgi:hypothetical protein
VVDLASRRRTPSQECWCQRDGMDYLCPPHRVLSAVQRMRWAQLELESEGALLVPAELLANSLSEALQTLDDVVLESLGLEAANELHNASRP